MRYSIALLLLVAFPKIGTAQLKCCYQITAVDTRTGLISAVDPTTRATVQFQIRDRLTLSKVRVNQQVYVDLAARQVGLDGRQACCAILGQAVGAPAPTTSAPPAPTVASQRSTAPTVAIATSLPTIEYGPPQKRTAVRGAATNRFESVPVSTTVAGRGVTGTSLHLRGLKAVEQAPGLPDGARRLLVMATRRLPRDQSDHFIVNPQMAQQWIATHPVPDDVKATEPKEKKCGNWYDSWDCATEAVSDEWDRAHDHAVKEWDHATEELSDAWGTTQACFTERTLSLSKIPVQFAITPKWSVDLEGSGSKGAATGTLKGSVGVGIPIQADFDARVDLFYIPCLPFAVRPKALAADGVLTVGEALTAAVTATGGFKKTFTIPPSGGPVIPIQVYPIVIAGVPVSELDVSVYIEGNIEVSATGKAEGRFQLENAHPTAFDFACDGGGCKGTSKGLPAPTSTSQGAQLEGRVSVKPAIYTALQLDFNYQALSARAGPQPYLLGVASGCGATVTTQVAGASAATTATSSALTGDLDWGVELRAEALVFRKIVGNPFVKRLMPARHIWFKDLASGGSSAFIPAIQSPSTVTTAQPALYRVRMPTCYPFTDKVQYKVTWTGTATAAAPTGCSWQAGQGRCDFDPTRDLLLTLTWSSAGPQTLSVVAVRDEHGRVFGPTPAATQVAVTVNP